MPAIKPAAIASLVSMLDDDPRPTREDIAATLDKAVNFRKIKGIPPILGAALEAVDGPVMLVVADLLLQMDDERRDRARG